jgi:hypothetical protein
MIAYERRPRDGAAGVETLQIWIAALVIAISTQIASVHAVQAQAPVDNAELPFDIPAQSLETALESFGERTRLQVLYETALTTGRRSSEVKGAFTRTAALRQLLSGTGLEFTYTGEQAFTLVPITIALRATPNIADYNRFLGGVQAGVLAALCRNPETRPGTFRLAMQFWIGGAGAIEDPRLLSSTGLDRRDAAVIETLKRVAFGQSPPPDMPQPITMVLSARPTDARNECGGVRP